MVVLCEGNGTGWPTKQQLSIIGLGWDFLHSYLLFSSGSWCVQHSFVSLFILFPPPAIPEFHKKLSLLAFWMKCTGPSGVYHTSADKMMKQLDINFATTVNEECPGLAETGTKCCKKRFVGHQNGEELFTGLYSTFHLFSNPLEICFATAPRSHSKTNPTTLETVLAQNNKIRIGQQGEVSRKQNIILRFMS